MTKPDTIPPLDAPTKPRLASLDSLRDSLTEQPHPRRGHSFDMLTPDAQDAAALKALRRAIDHAVSVYEGDALRHAARMIKEAMEDES